MISKVRLKICGYIRLAKSGGHFYEKIVPSITCFIFIIVCFYVFFFNGNHVFVKGLDVNCINHRGEYVFNITDTVDLIWHYTPITIEQLHEGDIISITYSGGILETSPGEFENVIKVEVLDDEL